MNAVVETTAESIGSVSRETSVWKASTICDPITIGSIASWGEAACPPLPWTVIRKRSDEADPAPARIAIFPAGVSEDTCRPSTASTCGIFQRPVLDHGNRATRRHFLGRLEQDLDRSRKLVLAIDQQPGQPQQHGRVRIVAAGVHHAGVSRSVLNIVLFEDRQGIHVGPHHARPCRRRVPPWISPVTPVPPIPVLMSSTPRLASRSATNFEVSYS